ncbi:uncharacterized protein EI97DRAFT_282504 [Westerdykella ornata]|uniref:DNA/RNA-binding protein Alba-like domain-containing protein n=1 Tax=Westerdykella ornata TaxID=318751 RepID=A0A6A6JP94_WESOR|nr:uncharacterized protein EI97DRAFT_282504 [Westerdykella ornata]KAF2278065.1 hypothetical protein EI97DRAFT_282504 [Westerdykella ornata]
MTPARPDLPSTPLFPPTSSPAKQTPTHATPTPLYSSEGPTLPIIGAPFPELAATAQEDERGCKRRRTGDIGPYTISSLKDSNFSSIEGTETKTQACSDNTDTLPSKQPPQHRPFETQMRNSALAPLYEPWDLLPAALQTSLRTRIGSSRDVQLERHVIPIAFTKNQNFKAGVNKIKAALDAVMLGGKKEDGNEEGDRVIAVSAQGEGTTKLVGIVDVARRVVQEEREGSTTWYWYTALTSRVDDGAGRKKKRQKELQERGVDGMDDESEDDFQTLGAVQKADALEEKAKMRRVPILTVWMSTKQMPGFKDAYGEETVRVAP